jgi:hypothetical protein
MEFLSYGTRTGKLAYLAPSGRPLVAAVWFIIEGDSLVFNTGSVPGELVVRLRPVKVLAGFDLAG